MKDWFRLVKCSGGLWEWKYFREKLGFLAQKYHFLGEKNFYAQCKLDKQAIKRDHCPLQTMVISTRFSVFHTTRLSLLFGNLKSVLPISKAAIWVSIPRVMALFLSSPDLFFGVSKGAKLEISPLDTACLRLAAYSG